MTAISTKETSVSISERSNASASTGAIGRFISSRLAEIAG